MSAYTADTTDRAAGTVNRSTLAASAPSISALYASYRAALAAAESVTGDDAYGAAMARAERIAEQIAEAPAASVKCVAIKLDLWEIDSSAGQHPGPLSDRLIRSARADLGRLTG